MSRNCWVRNWHFSRLELGEARKAWRLPDRASPYAFTKPWRALSYWAGDRFLSMASRSSMNLSAAARSVETSEILAQRERKASRWSFRSFSTFLRAFRSGMRKIIGMESYGTEMAGTTMQSSLRFSGKSTTPWSVGAMVLGRKTTIRDQSARVTRWSKASPAKDSSSWSRNFRTGTWNSGSADCSPWPRERTTLADMAMGPFWKASTRGGAGSARTAAGGAPPRGGTPPRSAQTRRDCRVK